MNRLLITLAGTAVAAGLVAAFKLLPAVLLLPNAHRMPTWLDFSWAAVPVQVALLILAFLACRASATGVSREPVTATGAFAGAWFVLGTLILSVLVSTAIVFSTTETTAGPRLPEAMSGWDKTLPVTGIAGGVVLAGLVAPIIEEFLFRGLIIGLLLRRAPAWTALVVSTALFAAAHTTWITAAFLGAALGLLYLRFENLWLCAAIHGVHNLVSAMGAPIAVAYLHDARLLLPVTGNLLPLQICGLVAVLACFGMFLWDVLGGLPGGALRFLLRPQPAVP